MKKFLPIIIILVSISLLVVGFTGISRNSEPEASGQTDFDINNPAHVNDSLFSSAVPVFGDLLDVGMPKDMVSQIKDYTGFRISFNRENGTPNWVSWELLGSETEGESKRSNKFWCDPEIDGCAVDRDYVRSGYDRGHIVPAADQKWSQDAMHDCFVLANICPQDHSLNSGAWNTLENKERVWAKRDSAIFIVAGPIYDASDKTRIGNSGVRVPSAFYKVILAPFADQPRAIGFVYPNMSSPGNMQNYATTVDEVENLTGLDFFHSLPDDIENMVESKMSFKEWNSRR